MMNLALTCPYGSLCIAQLRSRTMGTCGKQKYPIPLNSDPHVLRFTIESPKCSHVSTSVVQCPFCCRARVALGLKKVKYDVLFLASHGEATPISLVGSKQAPILVPVGEKPFPESWDIVKYVDGHYDSGSILKPASGREDLAKWIDTIMPLLVTLYLPRFHAAPLPEFTLKESRDYFKNKKEASFGSFSENIAKSLEIVKQVNQLLKELESLLHSNHSVNEELSYDDLDVFGRLRGLTLVKGVEWPTKVREFLEYFSKEGDVPLYDNVVKI